MPKMNDLVMHLGDRREGYIGAEMTGIMVEDDYGDMSAPESKMVWVQWNSSLQFPEHVARERLVKIAGFLIQPPADGLSDVDFSAIFESRQAATAYLTSAVSSSAVAGYSIVPVNEQGVVL